MNSPAHILKSSFLKGEWDFTFARDEWFCLPTKEDAPNWFLAEDDCDASWRLISSSKFKPKELPLKHWELLARTLQSRDYPPDCQMPPKELFEIPTPKLGVKMPMFTVSYCIAKHACSHLLSASTPGEAIKLAFALDGVTFDEIYRTLLLPPADHDELSLREATRNLCLLSVESKHDSLTEKDWEGLAQVLQSREFPEGKWVHITELGVGG